MTSVLVIDPDPVQRGSLEKELKESNQFGRVVSCPGFEQADSLIPEFEVEVVLVDRLAANNKADFSGFQSRHPKVGLVLVQEGGQMPDTAELLALGAHAQTSRLSSPIEKMSSIAKALVARLKPKVQSRKLIKSFFKE